MASHKPTHLAPLSPEEAEKLAALIDPRTGLPKSKSWYGGVRWERNRKYAHGKKHKLGRGKGEMVNDTSRS